MTERIVQEAWQVNFRHSYGRSGSELLDLLASDAAPAGTVVSFTSVKPTQGGRDWTVVACIELAQGTTLFARVVSDVPWTARTIKSQMKIGQRVAPAPLAAGTVVQSIADIAFVAVDS
jgi:uncharacterized OB-fold protein